MHSIGSVIAGWHIVRELHQGSMAVTYEVQPADPPHAPKNAAGEPIQPGRYVLKWMFLRDPSFQERLRRVGAAQLDLQHPHLVDIVQVIETDGSVGVVSRYVDGVDLSKWAAQQHPVPEVMTLFRSLVDGIVGAHDRGLVHRNLKPQKVLITEDGTPYVHDFMLGKTLTDHSTAALTQMGTTFGTPQYMSPEQFRGAADVDARTDLFSLGCLLFELLTGRRAFDGMGLMDIYKQVSEGAAPAPSSLNPRVPEAVDALVADLLAVDRDDRPASARIVAQRLDHDPQLRSLLGLPALDPPAPPSTTTPPPPTRTQRPPGATLAPVDDLPTDDDETELAPPSSPGDLRPEPTEELVRAPEEVAAADPRPAPAPSAPVPPPPLAAHNATGNLGMAVLILSIGLLIAAIGLVAGVFVF